MSAPVSSLVAPAHPDTLPDCRTRSNVGSVRTAHGNRRLIYCANCGCEYGWVPEEMITFAFALCNPCSEKYGDPAHFLKEPDTVFWERVASAQLEEHGKILDANELAIQLDDTASTLAKLAAEWNTYARSK